MRITDNVTTRMVMASLQQQQEKIYELQRQISSGLRINAPSDDPVSAQQALNMKTLIAANEQYARNISTGTTWLSQMDSSLSDMNNVMVRAKELATQMANGTYDAAARQNAVNEINGLKEQLISLGNTQIGGKYIFGGFVSDQPPFRTTDGVPTAADRAGDFIGSDDSINIQIDQQSFVSINYSGGRILRGGTPPGSSGTDIIGLMDNLATALSNNDTAGVRSSIDTINTAMHQIQAAQGEVGARENRLEKAQEILSGTKDYLAKALSDKEDADSLQVISDLAKQQTTYQATLQSTAMFARISLLDYMK
jgi:flagellar hook-associated protein 3 FlgL